MSSTALDACSRRLHAHTKGYIVDPFVHLFAPDDTVINSPLMNRGTWLREKAVECVITQFSKLYPSQPIQVVSLGAGFDTLYFRWAANPALSQSVPIKKYLELDLPSTVEKKQEIIQSNSSLSQLTRDRFAGIYHLQASNLCDTEAVRDVLVAALDVNCPTIFIAECVLVYFEAKHSTALLKAIAGEIFKDKAHVFFFSYDAISPKDRFGQMMLQNLSERGIHLNGIQELPDVSAHEQRARLCGFVSVKGLTMKALYLTVPPQMRRELDRLEMIDDWDEWNIVHEHYCIVMCWKGGDGHIPFSLF